MGRLEVDLNMQENATLAVDLGGTKTAVAVVSQSGEILSRAQEPTCQDGPEQGIDQLERMLRTVVQTAELTLERINCVGIGIPAVLTEETDRIIWAPNIKGWRDVDLRGSLASRLKIPVFIEYDGHTAALAEWWLGAGRGCNSLITIIVGTGIGGGMILDGKLYRGANRLAGAVGWFALTGDADHQDERQQSLGFWESLAAGPGIALSAGAGVSQRTDSLLWAVAKERQINCTDIFAAAQNGDAYARSLASNLADLLGLGIANIVSLMNPERIILGGGVGGNVGFLLEQIQAVVRRWAQPVSASAVQIMVSRLGGDAGLLGAAYGAMLRCHAPASA